MKCCMSTDVWTWTNWLTFEPNPDYSLDAGSGLLSQLSYKLRYTEFYVGKIPRIHIGRCSETVVIEWFYSVTRRNNFIRGTCAPPSAHLVVYTSPCRQLVTYCIDSFVVSLIVSKTAGKQLQQLSSADFQHTSANGLRLLTSGKTGQKFRSLGWTM